MYRIGIDIGGTFTDLTAVDDEGRIVIAKCASQGPDVLRETVFGHIRVGPDGREQLLFREDSIAMANERDEDVERLRFQ